MKIAHINIRSIFTGFNEFSEIVLKEDFDIVAVTETWLSGGVELGAVAIQGYKFFHWPRTSRGGGVGIYYRDTYSGESLSLNLNLGSNLEYLFMKFRFGGVTINIGVFYRPPNCNLNNCVADLDNILSNVCLSQGEIICLGDLNVDFFKMRNPVADCFESYGLSQILNEPTRITCNTQTLIDPIFISNDELMSTVGTIPCDGISDHRMVYTELKLRAVRPGPRLITFRCFNYFDYDKFLEDLYNLPWMNVIVEKNIDEKISTFNRFILELFNKHAPLIERRVSKPRAPWLTDNLKMIMKLRDRALQKFKRSRSEEDWISYKKLRNFAVESTRGEKSAYLRSICVEKNSSKTWRALRNMNIRSGRVNVIPTSISHPEDISEHFASFSRNSSDVDPQTIDFYSNGRFDPGDSFSISMTSAAEVNSILNDLKSDALGIDNINATMLKYCSPFIDDVIVNIINSSIEESYYPDAWKVSIGRPIPKKNDVDSYDDLRVISILPTISKIFEKVLYNQIYKFVKKKILPESQCGFRRGFSTATALTTVLNDLMEAHDRGMASALILLDYSKAFDTIDHGLLISKLIYYGFDDPAVSLLHSYLQRRSQRIFSNGIYSSPRDVHTGVPQGSILGPLLFIIYTADILGSVSHCKVQAYADDVQLYMHFDPSDVGVVNDRLNEEMANIASISRQHALNLNAKKTVLLCFSSMNTRQVLRNALNVSVGDTRLPLSESARNLGLHLDVDLRFCGHVRSLLRRAYTNLKLLYSNRHVLSQSLKRVLCESLVLSHFTYCDFLYGPCLRRLEKDRIQRVQNNCCRLIYGLRKFDHISGALISTGWLNMDGRRKLHLADFTVKLLRSPDSPKHLLSGFVSVESRHGRGTRFGGRFLVPRHRTAMFCRSFIYCAVSLLNSLPEDLRNLSVNRFRVKYKQYLLNDQNRM